MEFYRQVSKANQNKTEIKPTDIVISSGGTLSAWENRYGSYIWIGVAPEYSEILSDAEGYTDSADIEALGFCEYLNGKGSWLPFASGETVQVALDNLNEKLSGMPKELLERSSAYWERVTETFKTMERVSDGNYGISTAIDSGDLPATYS